MKTVNNLPHLSTLLCLFIVLFSLSGCDSVSNTPSSDAFLKSARIKGIVLIESPKMGSLLHLRGIAGKGLLIFKERMLDPNDFPNQQRCVSVPMRFAAGDFGGSNIRIHSVEPIKLLIYSDEIMEKLMSGKEIISEDYVVTDRSRHIINQKEHYPNDIHIESGLTLDYGFVLNPGEWSWSSLFGQKKDPIDCEWLDSYQEHVVIPITKEKGRVSA